MNYTLRKVNCKVLVVVVFCLISVVSSVRVACAYERVYVYTSGDFGLTGGFIPELANVKQTYVLDASPRSPSFSSFVMLSYDSLADLVFYCNEHGLSTTLVYNNACSMYVAFVQDSEFKISAGKTVSISGCLGNSDGKVYVVDGDTGGGSETVDLSGVIQWLKDIYNKLSSFSVNANNLLGNIGKTLANIYYYGDIRLQELIARVQSAGDHLGVIESYLQIYFEDMAADIHSTTLDTARIRAAAENINSYTVDSHSFILEIDNEVSTIADRMIGWSETFDKMKEYLLGIGSNSSDIYLTNKSILAKLNNLTIPASYDDTELLKKLDTLNMSAGMQWVNNYLSSINQSTGKMLDMFSLGETKTLTVAASAITVIPFTEFTDIQSVAVYGNDDSGSVLFASGGFVTDFGSSVFAECDGGLGMGFENTSYFRTVDVDTDTLTITVKDHSLQIYNPRVPAGTYTVSLYDPSGALISLAAGDKLRPSSTVGRWEVLRAAGGIVSIASCTGLPDGCEFADLNPRCVRVPVRDIIAAPSLLLSYAHEFGSWYNSKFGSSCILVNTSGQPLTLTYITPSPLLNWYANRQDDFRYWLDTRLSSLPASKSADLTGVTSRLDAILSQLQSSSGSASCEHTYQQHMEQEATCTLPGLQVSTCSQCGDSYSEIIDPLGHDWQCTDHVAAVTDPETGEETAAAYDIYTCSRCGDTYNDYSGEGAPEDYSSSTISQLIVRMFSKLGTLAGKLIGGVVRLFDKAITSLDSVVTKFNDYVTQISGFGGEYPAWLTGFWAVIPAELQAALTFAVICMALGVVGKKLFFS